MRIDHVAIEVADFEAQIEFLTVQLGLTLRRTGSLVADPTRRVAMLADDVGTKIELVEGQPSTDDRLLHLAFDVSLPAAVDTTFAALVAAGCTPTTDPRRFEPARSRTAMVARPGGVVQLVAYDADSPDAATAVSSARGACDGG